MRPATSVEGASERAALLLVAATGLTLLVAVFPLAGGLLAAPALTALCSPVQQRLATRVGARAAALLVVLLVLVVAVFPIGWLAVALGEQVPTAMKELQHGVAAVLARAPAASGSPDMSGIAEQIGSSVVGAAGSALGPVAGGVAGAALGLSIALLGLYYLLVADGAAWRALQRCLPFSKKGSDELRSQFVDGTRATVLGTLLSASLQGISIGAGLYLIGNAAPVFWGVVAAFSTLVPVVGNALVWLPVAGASAAQRHFGDAVTMLLAGGIVSPILDRVTRLAVSRHVGHLHPMVTLIGALAGAHLLGAVGILVGPGLLHCGLALAQLYGREYGLPWAGSASE